MGLVDAVLTAYMLNATLVLPRFYQHYDFFENFQEREVPGWTQVQQHDSQARYAVSMSSFYDVDYFKKSMAGVVDTVDALPPWLQGD
jgi:hypothetical protein